MSAQTEEKTIDHQLLEGSVEYRQQFMIKMLGPDGKLPEDPKDRALILKALDGIDKIATTRLRIKQEDRATASNEKIAQLLAGVYKGISVTNNPYVKPVEKDITPAMMSTIPTIPEHLRGIHLVEGETAVNPRQMSYKEFTEDTPIPIVNQD
jgi:hypothetical protein